MAGSDSDRDGGAPQRSRRQLLIGGAAGALGMTMFETLADSPAARAAAGGQGQRGSLEGVSATTTTPVTKVSAGDASIHVSGAKATPKLETGTLDEIAALHPPAAAVNFNSQRGINVANGSAATDIAAFGQLPSNSAPLPLTAGGTGLSEPSAAALLGALGALPETGGALSGGLAPTVVALSQSGGSEAIDASQGNVFTLTLTSSGWTITRPANPIADGQLIRIRLIQDGTGGRSVSWDTTGFDWGTTNGTPNTPPTLSTAANATDIVGFEYIKALSAWCFLGAPFPQGF
jgi:hypothetical protein